MNKHIEIHDAFASGILSVFRSLFLSLRTRKPGTAPPPYTETPSLPSFCISSTSGGLYVDDQNKHTIWESLGFDKRRIIKSTDLADIQAQLNNLAPGASPLDIQGIIPPSLLHMRGCKSSGSVEYRTVVSPHAGTHENHNGLYVASQVLGNDTMVARSVDDTTMAAYSSDVLQFINNDVPRFSHLTYHTEVPMWNVLTKNYLNNFDIEIRDHKGHLFPRSAIADFVMVLMFEVVDEINENIDDVVAYQTQAYREGHPTSSGNIFS